MSPAQVWLLACTFFGMVGMWWWGHPPTNQRIACLERRVKELEEEAASDRLF